MLISIDWINDFVDLPDLKADDFYNRFTLACAEVEEVLEVGAYLQNVSVAKIVAIKKHPDADKLNLVSFETGDGVREVVCGAPNVREGLKVPYAVLGTVLPGGFKLEPKKIRGILSEGMLCSATELDLEGDSSGLYELDESAKIGQTMLDYLGEKKDILLDVDNKSLTHRPDLWGHYGHAREFATIFESPLKDKFSKSWSKKLKAHFSKENSPIVPVVKKDSSCTGYFGLSVNNVTVAPSPSWIQRRLKAVGLRPINNIVDISNYVMLEMGHPLHIFDRNLIEDGELVIERCGSDQNFSTLDEIERPLISTDTIIRDSKKPLVIAGIMGGANSGVQDDTSNIFIEVANWKPAETRRTSTRLGLRTESSQRFEKSLDTLQCEKVMLRTLELVLELCPNAKVVGSLEYDGPDLSQISILSLDTSGEHIRKRLGKNVSTDHMVSILSSLEFGVERSDDQLKITVPSFRATKDVECVADIIEEVGRIIGYDNIEASSPKEDVLPVTMTFAQKMHRNIQDFMVVNARAHEVLTYPLVGESLLKKAEWPDLATPLTLQNALSKDADRMRPSLIPGFLEKVSLNQKTFESFRFFELGRSYLHTDKVFSTERSQIILGFFSKTATPFMDLVNVTEDLVRFLNLPAQLISPSAKFKNSLLPSEWMGIHPHEHLDIRLMGKIAGAIMSVHPLALRNFKIKGHLSLLILDYTDFLKTNPKDRVKYKPLPKFPGSQFDCTVVVSKDASVGEVLKSLSKLKIKSLVSTKVVDIYAQDDGQKSVTLRTHFLDSEKTLDGDFIHQSSDKIVETLRSAGFPLKGDG
ncbi:MAG: phenylalanine--tRNA ligase subunit beta [Bacteriovoracaceae bacterium]|jgi:phenylalanyl-tRNA synthetase beta chain|nr:phenylalanine--tRNA ligase subunit beta [Bacteriovoracaceae bacterium]